MEVIAAVAIGLVGGAFGAVLGVGGGTVFVPALVLLLGVDQHTAQGVSLVVIVPTAVSATLSNVRAGEVDRHTVLWLTPFAIAAAVGAAVLAGELQAETLSRIFGIVAMAVGVRTLLGWYRAQRGRSTTPRETARRR